MQHIAASFGGQIAFLLTNFILFLYLIKGFSTSEYGAWAIYITLISIADGIRQGFVQNGFISFFIRDNHSKSLTWSAFSLNTMLIVFLSIIGVVTTAMWSGLTQETELLLKQSWKTLISIGLLQFFNSYYQAHKNQVLYLINNIIYLSAFIIVITFWGLTSTIGLQDVQTIQVLTIIPSFIFFLIKAGKPSLPQWKEARELMAFGKYAAGTNLSSLLFHKVDILMIGYFLNPSAVAVYHLTMKVLAYAELPMQALSQFIYPKMVDSLHANGVSHLNKIYSRSILMLLVFVIPVSLILILFNRQIILLLSTAEYLQASELIIMFAMVMMIKPWGRIFGLSLDAIGKPRVNFLMLLFSLAVNVTLNLILIPKYGLYGGALATTISITSTITIGQILLAKTQHFNPLKETIHFVRKIKKQDLSWT